MVGGFEGAHFGCTSSTRWASFANETHRGWKGSSNHDSTSLLDRRNRYDFLRQENRFSLRLATYRSPDSSQTTLAGQPVNVLLAQACCTNVRAEVGESAKLLRVLEKKICPGAGIDLLLLLRSA
jgi:hypothetical protein